MKQSVRRRMVNRSPRRERGWIFLRTTEAFSGAGSTGAAGTGWSGFIMARERSVAIRSVSEEKSNVEEKKSPTIDAKEGGAGGTPRSSVLSSDASTVSVRRRHDSPSIGFEKPLMASRWLCEWQLAAPASSSGEARAIPAAVPRGRCHNPQISKRGMIERQRRGIHNREPGRGEPRPGGVQ